MKTILPIYEEGLSGKCGDVVYYNRKGKTFKRKAPGRYNINPTPKQALARANFVEAHRFAQSVIADPALKAIYDKKGNHRCTVYIKAISEYLMLLKTLSCLK